MPPHLRWELYPAGSAAKGMSEGSYLEQQEWWNRPWHRSRLAEMRFMAKEMFLFHRCYANNRAIWRFTLPFHWGMYLLAGWLAIQFVAAVAALLFGVLGRTTNLLDQGTLNTAPIAMVGLLLGVYGCTGLVLKRLSDRSLRSATSRSDFFGLFLILATLVCWLFSWALFDRSLGGTTKDFRELMAFAPLSEINPFMVSGIILLSMFLAYMPFTHMAHAFAKYFIYHKVVWQDKPMLAGSETERRIEQMLQEPVGWSATHIGEGASWEDTVSSSLK